MTMNTALDVSIVVVTPVSVSLLASALLKESMPTPSTPIETSMIAVNCVGLIPVCSSPYLIGESVVHHRMNVPSAKSSAEDAIVFRFTGLASTGTV